MSELQEELANMLKDIINNANESINASHSIYIPNKNVDKMNNYSREIIQKASHSLLLIGKLSKQ